MQRFISKYWPLLLIATIIFIILIALLRNNKTTSANSTDNNASANTVKTLQADKNINPTLPKINPDDNIIKHKYYTLSYNEKYEQANWVAYKLTTEFISGDSKRKDNFRVDPLVESGSADPKDYKKSGYDRGHLCPAGDMTFSDDAMSETFYMSNMSPQYPQFNRGIWKKLEEKVRDWADENNVIYITTGPVIKKPVQTIGADNVAIPQYYFKVILDYEDPELKGIGFIMKNEGSQRNLESFAVTIDSVESFTGINFFEALPDSIENLIEKKKGAFNF